jgi:hypothetical protein
LRATSPLFLDVYLEHEVEKVAAKTQQQGSIDPPRCGRFVGQRWRRMVLSGPALRSIQHDGAPDSNAFFKELENLTHTALPSGR